VSGSLSANVPAGVAGILDDYVALDVAAEITGGQNGTLDVYLQTSTDGGAGSGTTQGGSVIVRLSAARPRLREAGGS
jgi:hypothetical protein